MRAVSVLLVEDGIQNFVRRIAFELNRRCGMVGRGGFEPPTNGL